MELLSLSKTVKRVSRFLEPFPGYCWLAGGMIADTFLKRPFSDIDVFFPTVVEQMEAFLILEEDGYTLVSEEEYHKKYRKGDLTYDIFYYNTNNPQDTIELFGYQHCMAAVDSKGQFFSHPEYFDRLKDMRVVPHNLDNYLKGHRRWPVSVPRRLLKFLNKGYTIDNDDLITVLQLCIDIQDKKFTK